MYFNPVGRLDQHVLIGHPVVCRDRGQLSLREIYKEPVQQTYPSYQQSGNHNHRGESRRPGHDADGALQQHVTVARTEMVTVHIPKCPR